MFLSINEKGDPNFKVLLVEDNRLYCLLARDFFFQAEDGIRDRNVTGVQTCALPIYPPVFYLKNLDKSPRLSGPSVFEVPLITRSLIRSSSSERSFFSSRRICLIPFILNPFSMRFLISSNLSKSFNKNNL